MKGATFVPGGIIRASFGVKFNEESFEVNSKMEQKREQFNFTPSKVARIRFKEVSITE